MAFLDDAGVASLVEKFKAKMEEKPDHTRVVLWQNYSASSAFAAQTITLPESVDNYLFWMIECYLSTTVLNETVTFIVVGKYGTRLHCAGSGSNSNRGNSRDVTIDSTGTRLTFTANYYNNATTNTNLIPKRVYGFFHL